MKHESISDNRKAAMDAARRRLARLKLASLTTSLLAMGELTTAIAQETGAYTAAGATAQVVGSVTQPTAAQSATAQSAATTSPSPSPTASATPAIVSAQS